MQGRGALNLCTHGMLASPRFGGLVRGGCDSVVTGRFYGAVAYVPWLFEF